MKLLVSVAELTIYQFNCIVAANDMSTMDAVSLYSNTSDKILLDEFYCVTIIIIEAA